MPDRAAKFVAAIFASVLACGSFAALSLNAVRAADDCLLTPKAETPAGSHWFYRIERTTKRHCWYLRAEGETSSQAAAPIASTPSASTPTASAPNVVVPAKPAAPVAAVPMQRAVADARAELPPVASVEPPRRNDVPASAAPVNPATSNANRASALDANALSSVVASRWPDPSAVSSTIRPAPAPTQIAANAPPQPDPQQADSAQADSTQSDAAAVPPPAAAVVPLAAADSSQGLPASLPMLLAVMTGALMLAGITASIVLKFGRARRAAGGRIRRDRIWDSVDQDVVRLPARRNAEILPRRPHLPRDLDQPAEHNDRVADFYGQISKQARRR
jgi:hypothetical protein